MNHSTRSAADRTTSTTSLPTTLGLDLGDRRTHFVLLDGPTGQCLEEGKVDSTRDALSQLLARVKSERVVLEAGGHSPWVSRLAQDTHADVVVANPRKVALITQNERKTDRADAELLARLGRLDPKLLSPIRHRSAACQADLAVLRARKAAIDARTALINHVRGQTKSFGYRVPRCDADYFHGRALRHVPKELADALLPIVRLIGQTTAQIHELDKVIGHMAEVRYPTSKAMRQVKGVGPQVSMACVLTLEDPRRIQRSRQVGPYFGLVPRTHDSGDSSPQLHITKAGDREVRRLLVVSANYILGRHGPDCDLRRFGLKLAARGGKNAKKRAKVAVARKLAVLLHHLWRTGEVYDPFHLARRRREPVPDQTPPAAAVPA